MAMRRQETVSEDTNTLQKLKYFWGHNKVSDQAKLTLHLCNNM